MHIEVLKSKIHRGRVSDANIEYEGSVTIDPDLLRVANMLVHEKVLIVDINTAARLWTYILEGTPGSREIVINGAAAKLINKGDTVIIMTFAQMSEEEAHSFTPKKIVLNEANEIIREI